jgi:hypothetical protein
MKKRNPLPSAAIALVLIPLAFPFSQTGVNLAGTVSDNRSAVALAGATVELVGYRISAVTDAAGRYSLGGATALRRTSPPPGIAPPALDPRRLAYPHTEDGPVRIRILSLSGVEQAVLHSGWLGKGTWEISLPSLSPGAYACAIATPKSRQAMRFLMTRARSGAGGLSLSAPDPAGAGRADAQKPAAAKTAAAAPPPTDTLLVSKPGYRTARVPILAYQQGGLDIVLESSSDTGSEAIFVPDPSWTCYMPDGIPSPSRGEPVLSITLQIGAIHDVGITRFGHRRQFDIKGGSISGRINGTVLAGGLEYELTLANGVTELEQIDILRADNIPILMRNAGTAPAGAANTRVAVDFEAPNSSSFAWLNTGKFAATRIVDTAAKTVLLDVFDISKAAMTGARIAIKDPAGVPDQTWECFKLTGGQGASVFTESVTLGTSISIGASKRGSRNIIPITGGTTTGRVTGKILNGGADYQLGGLDARYTLAPDNGELIIVRNCGANGLVPVFEARVDGAFAFLNENKYLSSAPGTSGGGVSITFYEKQ